jgi:hypothetical protein
MDKRLRRQQRHTAVMEYVIMARLVQYVLRTVAAVLHPLLIAEMVYARRPV